MEVITKPETVTDWPAEVIRLAKVAEVDVLAKADSLFADAAAEHERQSQGYQFECRRWGDFLTVFIERAANGADWASVEPVRKLSTSLNIGSATAIELRHGRCFDRRGSVRYQMWMASDKESGVGGWSSGNCMFEITAPPRGCHYNIKPIMPDIPKARKFVEMEPQKNRDHDFYGNVVRHSTDNYPRSAEDDTISFVGIGATIYAPAGKGQDVYDAIMAEIASGYERPAGPQ